MPDRMSEQYQRGCQKVLQKQCQKIWRKLRQTDLSGRGSFEVKKLPVEVPVFGSCTNQISGVYDGLEVSCTHEHQMTTADSATCFARWLGFDEGTCHVMSDARLFSKYIYIYINYNHILGCMQRFCSSRIESHLRTVGFR